MLTTKDTPNGRILSYCDVTPEMEQAADECFALYTALGAKVGRLEAMLPKGFHIRSFYGNGNCVIIDEADVKSDDGS
jgi:hypothetical protein